MIDKDVLIRSHAGMRLIALAALYNKGDFERLHAYIDDHFTADALATEKTAARLQALREQFEAGGKVRVQQVIAHGPYQVVVMMASERGLVILEDLQVEADYPHKIKAHTRQIVL